MYRMLCFAGVAAAWMLVTSPANADHFGSHRVGRHGSCYAPSYGVHYRTVTLGQVRGIGYGVPIGRSAHYHYQHHHHPHGYVRNYAGYRPLHSPHYYGNSGYYGNYGRPGVHVGVRTPGFGLRLGF